MKEQLIEKYNSLVEEAMQAGFAFEPVMVVSPYGILPQVQIREIKQPEQPVEPFKEETTETVEGETSTVPEPVAEQS